MEKFQFTVKGKNGKDKKYETVCTLDINSYSHNYICYTDNSLDENGEVKIFISAYTFENDELSIFPIEDEKEWKFIEKAFNKKINDNGGTNNEII
ncbi:MAG: DUF1292 domain-containing protein [Bacilli bacterium]|nr:DUF1292 domain-containing protein [Bacilli bacterium]